MSQVATSDDEAAAPPALADEVAADTPAAARRPKRHPVLRCTRHGSTPQGRGRGACWTPEGLDPH